MTSDFLLVLIVAEVGVGFIAAGLGLIVVRVSGIAFAVISLCIAQVLFTVAVVWREVTDGMDGMVGVPLPKLGGMTIGPGYDLYLLTAVSLCTVYVVLVRLVDSPFGRTLQAIRTNEERAASIGINVYLHKWIAFVFSWAVADLAGTLMVFLKAGTTPMSLHWTESGNVLIMVIFGGIGTLLGPIIGAEAASTILPFIRPEDPRLHMSVYSISESSDVLYGIAPTKMLELLSAVAGEAADGSIYGLHKALDKLKDKAPHLVQDRRFQKLATQAFLD